jgi:hypothetical protein
LPNARVTKGGPTHPPDRAGMGAVRGLPAEARVSCLSKPQLEERLYSFDAEIESNTIEVHVSRLRKKLGANVITTERGLGYRLGAA